MNFDGDRTRALFNFLNEEPPALAIPNLSTETTAPMNAVVKNLQPKEEFSVFCDRTAIVEEPAPKNKIKIKACSVLVLQVYTFDSQFYAQTNKNNFKILCLLCQSQ